MELLTGSLLALLSIEDIRKQKVSSLLCFGLLLCNELAYILYYKNFEILLPNILGLFLVFLSIVSKEAIGLADTVILWSCFLVININHIVLFMISAFLMVFLVSIPFFIIRKKRNKVLPFLPIIYLSYCLIQVTSWSGI